MPVLKVKKDGLWEELGGTTQLNGGNADTLDGKHAEDFALNSHTHDSYINQNAFGNIKVGTTTISADSITDTLTLVAGNNVTLTPNATSDKITISATNTTYTHPNSGVTAGTYNSVTVNAQGHITAGSNPATLAGYGIVDAYTKNEVDSALANFSSGKTLTEHLTEEDMILSSRQYGDKLPGEDGKPYTHVAGRIFFKRLGE